MYTFTCRWASVSLTTDGKHSSAIWTKIKKVFPSSSKAISPPPPPARSEEARRRQQDYGTYYYLALRYGALSNEDFGTATYPGKLYHNRISDAARVIQNWWWSTWPPALRRRKAAALAIQSIFRRFVQRRKWHSIIRLRTLWGSTRFVAHAFLCWRDHFAKSRRVALCIHRFRNRCLQRSLVAWACLVDAERKARDDVIRRRLKRVKEGLSQRIFQAWVRYAETSLAVKSMRRRICARPVLRSWRERASADRVSNRLRWSCTILASRLLRWRYRNMFLDHRRACCKIQRAARRRIGRVRVRRGTAKSRTRRAEEIVQVIEVSSNYQTTHGVWTPRSFHCHKLYPSRPWCFTGHKVCATFER